ncbi:MAG: Gfo/Idh/MocA family oxidoreductase [Lachnospiraceae bacterium]|nr:Gfo/Idh/MocA family oxidoreductase [Lachnospiraceae bacterium]
MSNWGIMATGTIAAKFAGTIHQMEKEGERLVAVASRDLEKAETFAKGYRSAKSPVKAYASYEAMCKDPEVEVIYIATPNNFHFENVKLCLQHGKHVLCEKPFTLTVEEARELFALAKKEKLFLMEAFWVKHLPLVKKLDEMIWEGAIGKLKHMRADFGFLASGARRTRKFKSELGGGALLDIGVYTIGFLQIFMKDKPSKIQSEVRMSEFGTDWFSELLCSYPGGETAVTTTAIGIQMPREGVFYGTEGYIRLPDCQMVEELELVKNDGTGETIKMPFDINGFEYQIRDTTECIKTGRTESHVMTAEDTCTIMELLENIRKSWNMHFPREE